MSTESHNHEDVKAKFQSLQNNKTEEDLIKEDEYILMANYLSEIERLKKPLNLNRKELAKRIKTSASYLTQVFRGDKPLNFYTLAKIQKALNIRFEVRAYHKNDIVNEFINKMDTPSINIYHFSSENYYNSYSNIKNRTMAGESVELTTSSASN